MRLFVTGTDTDVGKTVISAWLCAQTQATYWKPIQCGMPTDTETVRQWAQCDTFPSAYTLQQPASPHQAAAAENLTLSLNNIQPPSLEAHPNLIGEGAGGVLVPINESHLMIDLMAQLNWPVIVVARSGLGTLNHTLLTLQALHARQIPVLGVILNGPRHTHNANAIRYYGNVPILAEVEPIAHAGWDPDASLPSEAPACFPKADCAKPATTPATLPNHPIARWIQDTPLPEPLKTALSKRRN